MSMDKTLGYCHHCERPQVVKKSHRSPSGEKNCGLCGKNSLLFAILLFMGVAFSATTTDCTWVGWDSEMACGQFNSTFITYVTNVTQITNVTNVTNITQISNIVPGAANTVEVIGVFALLILILFGAAQVGNMRILGVFASLLLMLLGAIILTDGVVYKVGDINIGINSKMIDGIVSNTTINQTSVIQINESSTSQYAQMEVPLVSFKETLGLILVLLSLFGMLYYGLGVGKFLNTGK